MSLKVHHLNCATLCPMGAKWMSHIGGMLDTAPMVCHCLLVETNHGLVLIDTGFGLNDLSDPYHRLGKAFVTALRPRLDENETAIRQIEKLGFNAEDVRHIILSHLDIDHGGGISDFPHAQVHLYDTEYQAVLAPTWRERLRFKPAQWEHGPYWHPHKLEGESWNGFGAIRLLHNLLEDIVLIPLGGHTRGHSGVAVNSEKGWLFHCGDAFFHHHQISDDNLKAPSLLTKFQEIEAMNELQRVENLNKLKQLNQDATKEVTLFCSHDHQEFYCLQQGLPLRL